MDDSLSPLLTQYHETSSHDPLAEMQMNTAKWQECDQFMGLAGHQLTFEDGPELVVRSVSLGTNEGGWLVRTSQNHSRNPLNRVETF
jgi:hypothetical protein